MLNTKIMIDMQEISASPENAKTSEVKSLKVLSKSWKPKLLLSNTYNHRNNRSPDKEGSNIQPNSSEAKITLQSKNLLNIMKIQSPREKGSNIETKKRKI